MGMSMPYDAVVSMVLGMSMQIPNLLCVVSGPVNVPSSLAPPSMSLDGFVVVACVVKLRTPVPDGIIQLLPR